MADKSITNPDFIIVGSGASGAAISWRLGKAGFKVVCIEQGPQINIESYPNTKKDWEIKAQHEWNNNPNIRSLTEDYPVNDQDSEISPLMFNAVGGSTIHWTAHAPRFHPSDFKVKSLDGVADDWPISYKDLEPYYDLNDEIMGCSGINGDPANPIRKKRPMPPIPLGEDGVLIAKAFDKLGWHWWPSDNYINSTNYNGRDSCNYCGAVHLGCPRGAKASTDITYWPEAKKFGVRLITHCRVTKITTSKEGKASGVNYKDIRNNGKEHHISSKNVILACNGIGTPRLMLNSKSEKHPQGLGNSSGLLGKNLMFHPYTMLVGLLPKNIETYKGPIGNSLMSQEFYETDPKRDFVRGYTFQFNRSSGPITSAIGLASRPVSWGENHHKEFESRFGKAIFLATIIEDLPEKHNSVEIDYKLKDSSGIPSPKINYSLSDNSKKMIQHAIQTGTTLLKTAGATEILTTPVSKSAGWHLMGTARMGDNPENSVTDKWGRCHDIENLFIVDGSLFVTSSGVNPTPTIQALALRTGDYIAKQFRFLKK